MHQTRVNRYFVAVMPLVFALTAGLNLLPSGLAILIVKENGPIENLSALGYFVVAWWLARAGWLLRVKDGFSAGFLIALLGLRELDMHTKFTTMGIFKTRYYISSKVPGGEKLIVSVIVLIILAIAIRYLYRNAGELWMELRSWSMSAISLAAAGCCIVVSKMLDSLSGPIEPLVACFSNEPRTVLRISEETIELAIPIYLLFAAYYYTTHRSHRWQ